MFQAGKWRAASNAIVEMFSTLSMFHNIWSTMLQVTLYRLAKIDRLEANKIVTLTMTKALPG